MNKNLLVSAPVGAGVGTVIYTGLSHGFAHLDLYRVLAVVIVTFIIALPLVFFSRPKK